MQMPKLALAAIVSILTACTSADYSITLRNDTDQPLVPYPVVTTPGSPPQRMADPANTLGPATEQAVDPTGFNPLYFIAGPKISVALQFDLDSDPPTILVRISQHVVEPGQEVGDPALAPTLLKQDVHEPMSLDLFFSINPGGDAGFQVVLTEL